MSFRYETFIRALLLLQPVEEVENDIPDSREVHVEGFLRRLLREALLEAYSQVTWDPIQLAAALARAHQLDVGHHHSPRS